MGSTNKTSNYALSQWEENDFVLREDFNEDNVKIDAQLKTMSNTLGNLGIVTGVYNGTGDTATRYITLGFRPAFVLVTPWGGYFGEEQEDICLAVNGSNARFVSITSNGFSVTDRCNVVSGLSTIEGYRKNPYRYIAGRG